MRRSAPAWHIVLLFVVSIAACGNLLADEQPEFRVTKLAPRYRRIGTLTDLFLLDNPRVLGNGRWVTAELVHLIEKSRGKDLFPVEILRWIVGMVAIDMRNGKARLLESTRKDDGKDPTRIRLSLPLGRDSIGLATGNGESGSDSKPDVIWKWTPGNDRLERVQIDPRLTGLMHVLDGSSYHIATPIARTSSSREKVTLRDEAKRTVDLPILGRPHEYWSRKQEFAPGSGRKDLIVHYWLQPRRPWLQGMRLDKSPTVQWKVTKADLEKLIGVEVQSLRFPGGLNRPCRVLPFKTTSYVEDSDWLCTIEPMTGRIQKVHKFEGDRFLFPVASAEGGLVAYHVGNLEGTGLAIVDMLSGNCLMKRILKWEEFGFTKKRTANLSFRFPLALPVGFLPDKTLVIMDNHNLWTLPSPYTGRPKLVFSLTTVKPGYCCSE